MKGDDFGRFSGQLALLWGSNGPASEFSLPCLAASVFKMNNFLYPIASFWIILSSHVLFFLIFGLHPLEILTSKIMEAAVAKIKAKRGYHNRANNGCDFNSKIIFWALRLPHKKHIKMRFSMIS